MASDLWNPLYNPDSKFGMLCKMWIKMKCYYFSIFLDLYSMKYNTKTRYLQLKLINHIVLCKYTHSEVDVCNMLKKVGTGALNNIFSFLAWRAWLPLFSTAHFSTMSQVIKLAAFLDVWYGFCFVFLDPTVVFGLAPYAQISHQSHDIVIILWIMSCFELWVKN